MAQFPRLVIARKTRHLLSRVKILLHLNDQITLQAYRLTSALRGRWKPPTLPEDVVRFPKLAAAVDARLWIDCRRGWRPARRRLLAAAWFGCHSTITKRPGQWIEFKAGRQDRGGVKRESRFRWLLCSS
jgi:hypothetical protein